MPLDPKKTQNAHLGGAQLPLIIGYLAVVALLCFVSIWGIRAMISGAIITSGIVQVENNPQVLQHPHGGVVSEILARDGDAVTAGEIVLRFDAAQHTTELSILTGRLQDLQASKHRLIAEQQKAAKVVFDNKLVAAAAQDLDLQNVLTGHENLFQARLESMAQEHLQLENQITQAHNQIKGTLAKLRATNTQAGLLHQDLKVAQALLDQGLVPATRVSALRRQHAERAGEVGTLQALIAQLNGDIARLKIEQLRLTSSRREDVIQDLNDLSKQELELIERIHATQRILSQTELRTPVSGIIHNSKVFALRSVVSPAAPVMYVIPQDQQLVISIQINAINIDQVHIGQSAILKFPALDQANWPETTGFLSKISADIFTDEHSGKSYYRAEITPRNDENYRAFLRSGMPVDAFLETGERSAISYLLKPITGYFDKAFRER